jgi:hypothetical protein
LTKAQGSVSSFGSIAGKAAGVTALALAAVGVAAVKAASDLGESLNKAKVVFGSAQGSVVAFSETTAESLGISQAAALEATAGFGAMAQSAGLSEKASADLSVDLVKLAGDMASFNNQDPTEMLERLRSGLAGEAEPLRRFGVFISEARVETEAYASGIAKAGEELTDAQKVQARFNIIMADTAKQQGDFARTVGTSLPNQMRVLKAQLIDTAASLGQQLLPALLDLAKAFQDLLPAIKLLLDPLIDLIKLGAEAVGVLAKILTLKFDELNSGIVEHAAAMERLFQRYADGKIGILELENELVKLRQETGIQTEVTDEYSLALARARDNQNRAKQAAMEWQRILDGQADTTEEAATATRELTDAMRDQRLAVLASTNAFLGIELAAKDLNAAQKEVNDLERKGKQDTAAYEAAILDLLFAQVDLEDKVLSFGKTLIDQGQKQSEVTAKIKDMGRELGISKGAIDDIIGRIKDYIREIEKIPDKKVTTFEGHFVKTGGETWQIGGGFQHGGLVRKTGLAMVHKGEVFSGVNNEMGFGGGDVMVEVFLDGERVSGALDRIMTKRLERSGAIFNGAVRQ